MTAEHESFERDFPGDDDPLMAVITGGPLPESAREDAGLLAAHRSAVADVALLREHLGRVGHALADAGDTVAEAVAPPVRSSRRPFALALGALAVACAAAFLSGMAWLLTQSGTGADNVGAGDAASDSRKAGGVLFGSPRHLACARLVVEGTVTGTEPVPGAGRTRVTLDVTRTYKPERTAKSADPLVFLVQDGALGPLHEGDHALVGFPHRGDHPDALFTDEREIATERARILRSLPESRGLTCPGT
jgi:hypothetical protein